ncbi:MAG: ribosome assembly cofactor RimP [Flavobacteriaceae bacterium]|nr:ribosome assembly cofactor RimP [Flavobacteriaceae bacterium]
MKLKDKVFDLLSEALSENSSLFLIDLKIGVDNSIKISLDGDKGVLLSDCIGISRKIEIGLDREKYNFSLEVGSVGIGTPLVTPRQFKKNLGRKLEIKSLSGDLIKGELIFSDDNIINLNWKVREKKPLGKGKRTVVKNLKIKYNEIDQAKVVI